MNQVITYIKNVPLKAWIIIAAIIILIIVICVIVNNNKNKQTDQQVLDKISETFGFPLKIGSRNSLVSDYQKFLNTRLSSPISVDGIWGPETEAASIKIMKTNVIDEKLFNDTINKNI